MFAINFDAGKAVPFNLSAEQVSTLLSHPAVHQHILTIGLKNILQDCHASIVREDFATEEDWMAAKRAKAELKLGAMMNGDVRAQSNARKPKLNDEDTFLRAFILAELKKAYVAQKGKDSWKEKTEGDSGAAFVETLLEKHGGRYVDAANEAWKAEKAKRDSTAKLAAEIDFDI